MGLYAVWGDMLPLFRGGGNQQILTFSHQITKVPANYDHRPLW